MRAPLLALVLVYAITILGFVLIPGIDENGAPWRMSFFHAFYFVSYMATTIGFGEIPRAFSEMQRLWTLVSIYSTVVVWLYSFGTIIALIQDRALQQAFAKTRFARRVRHQVDVFYLICGYGETGSSLVQALAERNQHSVVIDVRPDRISLLELQDYPMFIPGICADARVPQHLLDAGLAHRRCAGVVAVTDVNESNLMIAITAKLLHPNIPVICRADDRDIEKNMASFGTDHILDPFESFASYLATALKSPCIYLLYAWLSAIPGSQRSEPIHPPRAGLWILCGYGRFGKAVYHRLRQMGIDVQVIESSPERTGKPVEGCIVGRGTESEILIRAGIHRAVGLVAGTDNDANNLSIIMTAQELNPRLFVIARENFEHNTCLFDAVEADVVMHPSFIIANRIRILLGTPLLSDFVRSALRQHDRWGCELISRITGVVDDLVPWTWEVEIHPDAAFAVSQYLQNREELRLSHLATDHRDREHCIPCVALLLRRGDQSTLLPDDDTLLGMGDRLLFCGTHAASRQMDYVLQNLHALHYVLYGENRYQGWVWQYFNRWHHRWASRKAGSSAK